MPEFCEGALWALKQLGDVLWERRQGMWKLERALKHAPPEDQQAISDVLEPLGGGVQDNVLSTMKNRLEARIMAECQRRMDKSRAQGEGT